MKKFLTLICTLALAAAFTACDDDEKTPAEISYTNPADADTWYYRGTLKVEIEDGSIYTYDTPVITKIVFDDQEDDFCNMLMYKANFHPNMPVLIDMLVNWVSLRETSTGYTLTGNNIVPLNKGDKFEDYTIRDLTAMLTPTTMELTMMCGDFPVTYSAIGYDPANGGVDEAGTDFSFSADEAYVGPFDVITSSGGTVANDDTRIEIQYLADRTRCDIMLYGVKFADRMPGVDILIKRLSASAEGQVLVLTGENIIPLSGGDPFESYPINDFAGTVGGGEFGFEMKCGSADVSFSGEIE